MSIYRGRTLEAWEQSKEQGADMPTAPVEKEVTDVALQSMETLEDLGVKFTTATKKSAEGFKNMKGKVQPTLEAAYKTAAASLTQQKNQLEAADVVSMVEVARKGGTHEEALESIDLDAMKSLEMDVERLDYAATTSKRASQTARLEFYRDFSTDEKAAPSSQEVWRCVVTYSDDITGKTTLDAARAMELQAQTAVNAIAEREGFRSGQLGTAEQARKVKQAVLEAGQLDVADRPAEHPTFESVREAEQSQRAEAKEEADPKARRKAARQAKRAEEKKLEKFYMTDEQREAAGLSGEGAEDKEDATAEAVA